MIAGGIVAIRPEILLWRPALKVTGKFTGIGRGL
jgi:hypothetical protein